jgi:glycosyltransferase involved in cell wall biosynthesis
MFTKYTSLVIPTRNRNNLLLKTLNQLKNFNVKFKEILVIDSSDKYDNFFVKKISKKYLVKFYRSKPSTSLQRNIGLKLRNKKSQFVMFLDDDIIFFKNSFSEMNKTVNLYKKNNSISGFGFNLITNKKKTFLDLIKSSYIIKLINLYSDRPGVVTKSGWHTIVSNIQSNVLADWFSTQAVIYKSEFITNINFNVNFGKYSYLEVLDFSLNVNEKKKKKILVNYSSRYRHPNEIKRNNINFGIIEIFNRFIIVKNHKFSLIYFFLGSFVRFLLSLLNIFKGEFNSFFRACGNIAGIAKSFYYMLFNINK